MADAETSCLSFVKPLSRGAGLLISKVLIYSWDEVVYFCFLFGNVEEVMEIMDRLDFDCGCANRLRMG